MINNYAISIISEGLKEKLNDALINQFGIPINFTFTKPPTPPPTELTINIMMYQALISPTLRNNDLIKHTVPDSKRTGKQYQFIAVPLCLHYLLSFYGNEEKLEPQRLMAASVGVLHLEPKLTPEYLNDLLNKMKERDANSIPAQNQPIDKSETEIPPYENPVIFSWSNISSDDNFKLWQALQTPYALSATFEASTAIIHCATRIEPYHAIKHGGAGASAKPHTPQSHTPQSHTPQSQSPKSQSSKPNTPKHNSSE